MASRHKTAVHRQNENANITKIDPDRSSQQVLICSSFSGGRYIGGIQGDGRCIGGAFRDFGVLYGTFKEMGLVSGA